MDGDVEYEFVAGGDACALCQALAGTTASGPISQPHSSCRCSIEARCENTYTFSHAGNNRYGPGGDCLEAYVEVEVTCWNGDTSSQTVGPIDFGCSPDGPGLDAFEEALAEAAADAASVLDDGCPDCNLPVS